MTIQNAAVLAFQIFLFAMAGIAILTALVLAIILIHTVSRRLGIELRLSFRARKIDGWNETKSVGLATAFGALGFLLAGIVINGFFGTNITIQYFTATGAAIGMLAGFWRHLTGGQPLFVSSKPIKTHWRQFASALPWHVKEGIDEKGILRWYDRRDKPAGEFMFYGDILPTVVPESMMYRFCRLALERQGIIRDSDGRTYKRTGRKLRSHETLSEVYFTSELSPKFLKEEYDAIYDILFLTGYWINRRVGHSGTLLVAHGTTPQKLVHRVRWGWIDIIIKMDKIKKPFWQ